MCLSMPYSLIHQACQNLLNYMYYDSIFIDIHVHTCTCIINNINVSVFPSGYILRVGECISGTWRLVNYVQLVLWNSVFKKGRARLKGGEAPCYYPLGETLNVSVFLISSYSTPLAHRASYLALHSSHFGPVVQIIMIILSLTALTLC